MDKNIKKALGLDGDLQTIYVWVGVDDTGTEGIIASGDVLPDQMTPMIAGSPLLAKEVFGPIAKKIARENNIVVRMIEYSRKAVVEEHKPQPRKSSFS